MDKNLTFFSVQIFGALEPFNDVLSKARCRIFYKYENCNGSYITDEFADHLLKTIPYTPIKGIFKDGDFSDHGETEDGRIYGIVPETPNIAYEKHLDEDGVEREYACSDVLLFTAIYAEAKDIVGKSQSMELFRPSIEYHTAIVKGQKYYVFDKASFLGLQVLGDEVKPCFEGSSFFSLQQKIEDTIHKIKEFSKKEVKPTMKLKFKLSDDAKFNALWTLLNPNYTKENDWEVSVWIIDVYDEYVLIKNLEENIYEKVFYTKDDEKDMVELGARETVFFEYLNENELNTVKRLRELNGSTFETLSEKLESAEENFKKSQNLELKIVEMTEQFSTLEIERDNLLSTQETISTEFTEKLTTLETELNDLRALRDAAELESKKAILSEYSAKLSQDILDKYAEKIADFSVIELDKELAYELKSTLLSEDAPQKFGKIPKQIFAGGIEEILSKYK